MQQIVAAEGFSGANEIDSKQREALTATLARAHHLNPNVAGEGVRLAPNNFYNQAREVVNASAALSYAEQQYVVAPANRVQSSENLLPLPADTPAAAQQAVKVSEPVAKLAAPDYAPEQALSF